MLSSVPAATIRKIGALTLGLLLVLYLIRAQVLDFPYAGFLSNPWGYYMTLLASCEDFMLAAGLGTFFMGLAYLLRQRPRAQPLVLGLFLGCALLLVWAGLTYVATSKLLGGPLTYAWLYYADFLQSTDSKAALQANISWAWAAEGCAWSAAFLGTGYLLAHAYRRFDPQNRLFGLTMLGTAIGLLVLLVQAPRRAERNSLSYKVMANPVVAFVQSLYRTLSPTANPFTMPVPAQFESFFVPPAAGSRPSRAPFSPRIRNVLLFVLESVPAEYVPGYQTRYPGVMPHLAQHLPQSLLVTGMYAQMPSTNNAVVALLSSLYPQMSYQSISREHPAVRVPSLSSELKHKQFRTGFFFAADTRFQNMSGFLANRKFDVVADYQTVPCTKPVMEVNREEEFLSSADEACLVEACAKWLPADSAQAPFFATVWTAQTHYPYLPRQPEKDYHVPAQCLNLNRYLNALHYSDKQLGRLLDELARRGLSESTLVVVMGDHGEAFGRHAQYGHASQIYEENVHVPLLLINPLLFHGGKLNVIGGQVDVAPSILDLLRLPIPAQWQGASLFDPQRRNRAYFFDPYSQNSFGFRTPQHKVIFDVYTGKTMVFDLLKDPLETTNLADQLPDLVAQSHQRLARWVQYQNAYIKRLVSPPPAAAPLTLAKQPPRP